MEKWVTCQDKERILGEMNSSTDSPTGAKGEVIYNDEQNVQEGQEWNLA
jgi:hypothetical protein